MLDPGSASARASIASWAEGRRRRTGSSPDRVPYRAQRPAVPPLGCDRKRARPRSHKLGARALLAAAQDAFRHYPTAGVYVRLCRWRRRQTRQPIADKTRAEDAMRVAVAAGIALLLAGLSSSVQAQGKVCDNPRPMPGFKTCADVEKAEAEGAFVLYSTDPEAGQVKLLAAFNKLFPKIKTSYVRLQAGALYAKVLSERQAKSYLVDVIQISDMGMILDFQKRGGFRQYVSPEMAAFKPEYKSQPEGYWTWGSIIMGGIAYNPNNVSAAEAPKTWEDL